MSDFSRAQRQITRAAHYGTTLHAARVPPAPLLGLHECRELARQSGFSLESLRAEFGGFDDGKDDIRELNRATDALVTEIKKPFARLADWLNGKISRFGEGRK